VPKINKKFSKNMSRFAFSIALYIRKNTNFKKVFFIEGQETRKIIVEKIEKGNK